MAFAYGGGFGWGRGLRERVLGERLVVDGGVPRRDVAGVAEEPVHDDRRFGGGRDLALPQVDDAEHAGGQAAVADVAGHGGGGDERLVREGGEEGVAGVLEQVDLGADAALAPGADLQDLRAGGDLGDELEGVVAHVAGQRRQRLVEGLDGAVGGAPGVEDQGLRRGRVPEGLGDEVRGGDALVGDGGSEAGERREGGYDVAVLLLLGEGVVAVVDRDPGEPDEGEQGDADDEDQLGSERQLAEHATPVGVPTPRGLRHHRAAP